MRAFWGWLMFEKIWQRAPIKSGELAEADRRIWDRLPSERQTIVLADDGEHLSARVQNVSRGGVRMLVNRKVEAGAMVSIALPAGEGEAHSTILACVVHIDAAGDGVWSMGCSFATELSDAEFQTLG